MHSAAGCTGLSLLHFDSFLLHKVCIYGFTYTQLNLEFLVKILHKEPREVYKIPARVSSGY
jgi:hypothetical protein